MNSKERVRAALDFVEPDRVPFSAAFVPEIASKLREEVGYQEPDLGAALGNDVVCIPQGFANGYYLKDEDTYTCEWGCKWRRVENNTGEYTEVYERPLEDHPERLGSYKAPDPYDDSRYDAARELMARYGGDHWITGAIPTTIFECAWGLRGLDNLLTDMLINKEFAHALMDKVMEFPLIAGKKLISLGADMLLTGDDVAMQSGMMMSMDMWREYLKPRYAYLFGEFKKENPKIKLAYHSDGNCEAILDELCEIGLDVLNPIQPACMDPVRIKQKYGRRLALWGGLCIQFILPNGSPEEVRAEVRRLKTSVGKGGGYILAPAHNIQSDTSLKNIKAFYEEALSC